jgi:hypothetical protein
VIRLLFGVVVGGWLICFALYWFNESFYAYRSSGNDFFYGFFWSGIHNAAGFVIAAGFALARAFARLLWQCIVVAAVVSWMGVKMIASFDWQRSYIPPDSRSGPAFYYDFDSMTFVLVAVLVLVFYTPEIIGWLRNRILRRPQPAQAA